MQNTAEEEKASKEMHNTQEAKVDSNWKLSIFET